MLSAGAAAIFLRETTQSHIRPLRALMKTKASPVTATVARARKNKNPRGLCRRAHLQPSHFAIYSIFEPVSIISVRADANFLARPGRSRRRQVNPRLKEAKSVSPRVSGMQKPARLLPAGAPRTIAFRHLQHLPTPVNGYCNGGRNFSRCRPGASRDLVIPGARNSRGAAVYWIPALATRSKTGSLRPE